MPCLGAPGTRASVRIQARRHTNTTRTPPLASHVPPEASHWCRVCRVWRACACHVLIRSNIIRERFRRRIPSCRSHDEVHREATTSKGHRMLRAPPHIPSREPSGAPMGGRGEDTGKPALPHVYMCAMYIHTLRGLDELTPPAWPHKIHQNLPLRGRVRIQCKQFLCQL